MKNNRGFTIIELFTVLFVIALVGVMVVPALRGFQKVSELHQAGNEIMAVLRIARQKSIAGESSSQHGVFFDSISLPNRFVLFQGPDYASRNAEVDLAYELPPSLAFAFVDLGGGPFAVFSRIYGTTEQAGAVTLELAADPSQVFTVSLSFSGSVIQGAEAEVLSLPDTDSRHAHIGYIGRDIDTGTESIVLDFGATEYSIGIAGNMSEGQIYWQGGISVDGETQELLLRTHMLNDPALGTEFSIRRDGRYNTKAVEIRITGDATGSVVQYDAAGDITEGASIYVLPPELQ